MRKSPGAGAEQARRNHEQDNTDLSKDAAPGVRVALYRRGGIPAGLLLEADHINAATGGQPPGSGAGRRGGAIVRLKRMRLREPTAASIPAEPFRGDASGDGVKRPRKEAHAETAIGLLALDARQTDG